MVEQSMTHLQVNNQSDTTLQVSFPAGDRA